jgi:Ca-activated chloride channel family protein
VLISDGIESCEGDPCAVASSLKEAGVNVKAHVVGFGLSKEDGKKLTCIADNSGGNYFDALNTAAFTDAIKEVAELTQKEPEPEPEPVNKVVFEDDFDGEELATHWDVLNPNPNQYLVEAGDLLLIGKDVGGLTNSESANIMQLIEELPKGDWTITVEFTPDLKTGKEILSFGLYTDEKNFVSTSVFGHTSYCCSVGNASNALLLETAKVTDGEKTLFEKPIYKLHANMWQKYDQYVEQNNITGKMTVQLIKKGRDYSSRLVRAGTAEGEEGMLTFETDAVTSLRAPKQFVINAGMTGESTGEALFNIHSVKIDSNQ